MFKIISLFYIKIPMFSRDRSASLRAVVLSSVETINHIYDVAWRTRHLLGRSMFASYLTQFARSRS